MMSWGIAFAVFVVSYFTHIKQLWITMSVLWKVVFMTAEL